MSKHDAALTREEREEWAKNEAMQAPRLEAERLALLARCKDFAMDELMKAHQGGPIPLGHYFNNCGDYMEVIADGNGHHVCVDHGTAPWWNPLLGEVWVPRWAPGPNNETRNDLSWQSFVKVFPGSMPLGQFEADGKTFLAVQTRPLRVVTTPDGGQDYERFSFEGMATMPYIPSHKAWVSYGSGWGEVGPFGLGGCVFKDPSPEILDLAATGFPQLPASPVACDDSQFLGAEADSVPGLFPDHLNPANMWGPMVFGDSQNSVNQSDPVGATMPERGQPLVSAIAPAAPAQELESKDKSMEDVAMLRAFNDSAPNEDAQMNKLFEFSSFPS